MGLLVRFAPELGRWLSQHLERGQPPQALIGIMRERGMEARAAQAIVAAFVAAREGRGAPPVDSVELPDDDAPAAASRLAPGTRLQAFDREIVVHMRSDDPPFAVLGQVLDAEECRRLIEMARPRLRPSTLVDPLSGADIVSERRGSHGMFFRLAENDFIARIDRRVSALMNLPLENGEGLQVLHYPTGAGSDPHLDYLQPGNAANRESIARSGQRVSTLVTYLNDVPGGGQTEFPVLGRAVSPLRGNAVYFEYGDAAGRVDPRSLHASAPVTQGEKWVVTKWMRQRRFVAAAS
ncbi:2OG-Fe(II) oxygenase [Solimonas soli]|uniref:2OG-Fe(II) oxygenase n=1 Tax=Solimonas soli TaxID=413479 RepID=UPI00048965CA|nr:2OG-Fe(II) oxygenase [Solimonas soli]